MEDKMGGIYSTHLDKNTFTPLVGKPYGKRPLGRYTLRWRIIIKWILMQQSVRDFIGFIWPMTAKSGGILGLRQ
jgi:hypothetical protein